MKKNFTLTVLAMFVSLASFAIGGITGTTSICVGSTTTLTDTTTGGSWYSGNTAVATVGITSGTVTGISGGTATITYYKAGLATVTVTINPTPTIYGATSVCTGSAVTLSDAVSGGSWISSNTAVATVTSGGVVTGISSGSVNIYYIASGCGAYHIMTVTGAPTIYGSSTVCTGSAITLTDATSGGSWSVGSSSVATVSSGGVVTGVSAGVTNIYYSVGGCSAYHTVTVNGTPTIYGASTLCAGSTITLSDAVTGGTWSVGSSSVATVSSGGVVTGVSGGVTNIYYSVGGCYAYHTVTVTGAVTISGASTVCTGATITLSDATYGGSWISSNTSVATVGITSGVVTGVSGGTVTIYYSLSGCYAYHTVTVTGAVTISGPSTVCSGSTITLSDATSGGTWTTGSSAIATVSSGGVVTGVSSGTVNIYYILGGCYAYHTVTVTGGSTISGPSTVCVGSVITLSDASTGGSWISSNTSVATVGITSGVVSGVSAGTATIYYGSGGCYAYHTVTVTGGPISGPSTVCTGATITLSDATTGGSWTSSNTSVATVVTSGIVTGVSAGTATIYYIVGGCYAYHTVTVTGGSSSITGASTVCAGSTITLSDATTGGSWISSNTSVATVGVTSGVVTGIASGTATIYYTSGGCYAYHTVTVTGGSGSISGPSTVCVGSTITLSDVSSGGAYYSSNSAVATIGVSTGVVTGISAGTATIYYSLSGCYATKTVTVTTGAYAVGASTVCAGSTITLTGGPVGGTWSVGASTIATVDTSGVVTGVSSGVTNIYYSMGGCTAYHTVTVTGGSSAISGPSTVCAGSTITLSDATTGGYWISSNTAVATVVTTGVVTGISSGTATISYSAGGCYAYHTVTVTGGSGSISGASTVCAGSTITLSDATTGGSWISSNTSLATVVTTGVVTGISAGTVTIYYSAGGCYAYHTVTVTGGSGSISGPSVVCAGTTITLSDAITGGTWTSSNTAIGSVTSGGVVTGVSSGTCTIYYLVSGCYAYHTVTVTGGSSITGPSSVCVGSTITLSDVSTGGAYYSSNSSVATIGVSTGVVTGISAGTATIYYSLGGCYATYTVTVTGGSSIIGASTVCAGSVITLSDATTGGSWISSNTSVATVGVTSGVVTGVTSGTATIYYVSGGCYAYHTVTVTGSPISGSSTVCVGSTITLSDATTGGYWLSSNTTVATVVTTGVVTGVSAGTATIYYIAGGCYAYHTVTVTGGAGSISGASTVCAGSTITLSDATTGGSWISGNTSEATVGITSGVVTGVSVGVVNIYYGASSCYTYHTVTVTGGSSAISGPSIVCTGTSISLSDATTGGTWTCSNTAVATITTAGVVTGVSSGTCTIYYVAGGCYAYHTVTVTGGSSITGSSTVCIGSTITLSDASTGGSYYSSNSAIATIGVSTGVVTGVSTGTVTIYYSLAGCYALHTVTVTSGAGTISGPTTVCVSSTISLSDATTGGSWSSSNTSIATVSSGGVVTGVSSGTANIYYIAGGCGAYHIVTVTGGSGSISGASIVCVGSAITLSDATTGGSWSSSNTSVATAGITSGIITGVSAGTTTIYYVAGGCYAYHTVTVTGGSSITGPTSVCVGSTITLSDASTGGAYYSSNSAVATIGVSTGVVTGVSAGTATIYYSLSGCYALHTITVTSGTGSISGPSTVCVGSVITLSDAATGGSWISSNTSVATVGITSGVVSGVSGGTATIYYTAGGCYAYHTVTVTGGPISGPSTVCAGSTITLSDATPGGYWLSSNTTVATVVTTGVVTGVSAGTATIYYIAGGCYAYHTVTVTGGSSITGPSTVCAGSTITLSDASTGGSYYSSNSAVATIGVSTGVVTGISAGTATIYYSLGGCYSLYTVTVTGGASIYGASTVCVGSTITLSDETSGGSWISSNTAIAAVTSGGVVTGASGGVVNIYYAVGGCYAYHTVTVTSAAISGASTVCIGSTITLSDVTSGGTWTVGSSAVATVSSGGVVTGMSAGVTNIYYVVDGCYGYHTVTVTAAPSAITGASSVYVGSAITLSDAVTGGTWLSGNTAVATVSSGGVVTGVATGSTNIYYIIGACGAYHPIAVYAVPGGVISGVVVSGDAKGTSGDIPVSGLAINLLDTANNLLANTNTDNTGAYSFNELSDGNYIVEPNDSGYTITPSSIVSIGGSVENITGIDFKEYTSSKIIVPFTIPTGIHALTSVNSISVFPNPTNGDLNIKWNNLETGSATITLTDVVGREVYKSQLNIKTASGQSQISLSELKSGIYLITIKSDDVYYSGKVMIEK